MSSNGTVALGPLSRALTMEALSCTTLVMVISLLERIDWSFAFSLEQTPAVALIGLSLKSAGFCDS